MIKQDWLARCQYNVIGGVHVYCVCGTVHKCYTYLKAERYRKHTHTHTHTHYRRHSYLNSSFVDTLASQSSKNGIFLSAAAAAAIRVKSTWMLRSPEVDFIGSHHFVRHVIVYVILRNETIQYSPIPAKLISEKK